MESHEASDIATEWDTNNPWMVMTMTAHSEPSFKPIGKRDFPPARNAFLEFGLERVERGQIVDKTSFVSTMFWRVLGFFIGLVLPMVGMGLYVLWRDDRPKDAKYPGIGTAITLIVVVYFALFIIIEYILFPTPFIRRFPIKIFPESTGDFIIPFPIP